MIHETVTSFRAPDAARDSETVRAAQSGDLGALDSLLTALAHELMPLANALTSGDGKADELVGDSLSRVYERLGQLDNPAAAASWARQILVRRFVDGKRWLSRRQTVPIETIASATSDPTTDGLIDLRAAVRGLSRQQRALLVLHYWEGHSIRECALELNIPEGTAKSRLNKALGSLRARLKEENM